MRVLVTGATGFLGSHVAEVLLEAGHEVRALVRSTGRIDRDLRRWLGAAEREGRLIPVAGSLESTSSLEDAAKDVDAVVHVAGIIQAVSESRYQSVNRDGTESLLRAVESGGQRLRRFIYVSSQAAGGPSSGGRPVSGEDAPRPVSAYGRSKLAGEERALARSGRFPVTIVRPPVIFGPRDTMLERMFKAVSQGRAIVWGDGSNAFNVVHAPDVARAIRLALEVEHPTGSILYTGVERPFTWRSFLEVLAGVIGRPLKLYSVPPIAFAGAAAFSNVLALLTGGAPWFSWDKLAELREPAWLCTSIRTTELLGWTPATTVEEALASTHAWYRARGLA